MAKRKYTHRGSCSYFLKVSHETRVESRFLEKEEIKKVYNTCPNYLRPIVALAICTGMRKEEILGLKWPDIDFRRKIITILKTRN